MSDFVIKPNPLPVITLDQAGETLRMPSVDVEHGEIKTAQFQTFLRGLKDSMYTVKLDPAWMHAGISAVQIGILKSVFLAFDNNQDDFRTFINPRLEYLGSAQDIKIESCLSIPDATGKVSRHKRVRVEYLDENGNSQRKEFTGWNARVIQHEFDHLQGVLFTDKVIQ